MKFTKAAELKVKIGLLAAVGSVALAISQMSFIIEEDEAGGTRVSRIAFGTAAVKAAERSLRPYSGPKEQTPQTEAKTNETPVSPPPPAEPDPADQGRRLAALVRMFLIWW